MNRLNTPADPSGNKTGWKPRTDAQMYLGIDLGTSEIKTLLLSGHHELVATHGVRIEVSRPQPSWSEQNPNDWWVATSEAVQA
ncbi:MAG: FGGY family carbohydrate kinase, partial [Blastocatellia bacterium]